MLPDKYFIVTKSIHASKELYKPPSQRSSVAEHLEVNLFLIFHCKENYYKRNDMLWNLG